MRDQNNKIRSAGAMQPHSKEHTTKTFAFPVQATNQRDTVFNFALQTDPKTCVLDNPLQGGENHDKQLFERSQF